MTANPMLRTRWAGVGAAVAITLGAVGLGGLNIASADVSSGDRPVFIPINPCRLLDTRSGAPVGPKTSPVGPGETYTVAAHGSNGRCTGASAIPSDALSLSLNVTAIGATSPTFLTFWGEGANPGTSNLNPRPGAAPTPNSVTTPLSASGTFNIYNDTGNVNIIADVNGYYVGHDHDDRYYTEAEADATFATSSQLADIVKVDRLVVGGFDFAPIDGAVDWSYEIVWEHDVTASRECVAAPIHLPVGQSVSGVSLRHNNSAAADVELLVAGTVGTAGSVMAADFAHLVSNDTLTLPVTGSDDLAEATYPLGPDLLVRSEYHYFIQVCSLDDVQFASVVIDLA